MQPVPGSVPGRLQAPGVVSDLHGLVQKPGETLRKYVEHFCAVMNTIPGVQEASAISSFYTNVREPRMREKLSTHKVVTTSELWRLADKCARAEEGRLPPEEVHAGETDMPAKKRSRQRD